MSWSCACDNIMSAPEAAADAFHAVAISPERMACMRVRAALFPISHALCSNECTAASSAGGMTPCNRREARLAMLTVPLKAMPSLAITLAPMLAGKVVIDTGNAYERRDGEIAAQARSTKGGSAVWAARMFPASRWVKAFNTVFFKVLESEAHREGDKVGIPLAGDDRDAVEQVAALVRDAGFEPVITGPLAQGQTFEPDTPVYNTGMTGSQVRQALGVKPV